MASPKLQALLRRINGRQDIPDVLKQDIDHLQKTPRAVVDGNGAYLELLRKWNDGSRNTINEKNKDGLYNNLSKDFTSVSVSKSRIKRYIDLDILSERIPILRKALNLYVTNIISPDDINKKSLRVVLDDDVKIEENENYSIIIDEWKSILKYLQLERKIDNIIHETLQYGDQFYELTTIPDKFARAVSNDPSVNDLKEMYSVVLSDNIKTKEKEITRECRVVFEERIYSNENIIQEDTIFKNLNENTLDSIIGEYDMDIEMSEEFLNEDNIGYSKQHAFDTMKKLTQPGWMDTKDDNMGHGIDGLHDKQDKYLISQLLMENIPINNVIILNKGEWILGYLYVYGDRGWDQSSTSALNYIGGGIGSGGSMVGNDATSYSGYSSGFSTVINMSGDQMNRDMFSVDGNYSEEMPASQILIDKIYKASVDYLSHTKHVSEIPDEFKLVIAKVLDSNNNNIRVRFIPEENMQHFKIESIKTFPYGESIFSGLIFQLTLHLTRMITSTIYKLARAGKHLVYYIDVSDTRDAHNRIESVKRSVRKKEVSIDKLDIETISSMVTTFDDFFIPEKDGKRWVNIDKLDLGDFNADRGNEDTGYLKSIITGLDIPPSLLGVEEYNNSKATLSQESIVFARIVIRFQKIFSHQLTSLIDKCYKILHANKLPNNLNEDLIITFLPPRGLMAESMSKIYGDQIDIINKLKKTGIADDELKRQFLPEFDWDSILADEIEKKAKEKKKKNEDSDELGGLDMGLDEPV